MSFYRNFMKTFQTALKFGREANHTLLETDGTMQAIGDATCWTDLRVATSSTAVNGSNPPTDALFKNDGQEIPGDAYALSFLSTTQGNLTLPDVAVFDTSNDFTFNFWLRPQVGTQNNIELMRKNNVFDLDFSGADQITLIFSGIGSVQSSNAFNRGGWNFISVQYVSGEAQCKLWINNMLAGVIPTASAPTDNTSSIQFNRQETLFDLDYIEYWDTALNSSELAIRYAGGTGLQLAGNEVGLKGLWELNDGSGTVVVEKTGIALAGSITGGSEGAQWAWVGGHVGNTSAGSRGVILKYFSPEVMNEVYFDVQLPHEWVEGTELRPHVHWVANANGGVGERVKWGLEYTLADVRGLFGNTTAITATEDIDGGDPIVDKHIITRFPSIDMSGKKLSTMINCRLYRDAEDVSDTYTNFSGFLEVDFHYLKDMLGSREEFTK